MRIACCFFTCRRTCGPPGTGSVIHVGATKPGVICGAAKEIASQVRWSCTISPDAISIVVIDLETVKWSLYPGCCGGPGHLLCGLVHRGLDHDLQGDAASCQERLVGQEGPPPHQ